MVELRDGDALIAVDVQADFLPGGRLPVPRGDEVVPALNRWLDAFAAAGLPVFATRDWHPPDHCSFRERGGPWPVHCVAGSPGAAFAPGLRLPPGATIVSKADAPEREDYSAFAATDLEAGLRARGTRRVFVGGLATDYCVLRTVEDAVAKGFPVVLLEDAVRAVEAAPGDGRRALERMLSLGATPARLLEAAA
ncbi:MAG: isochorismatase family protein [Elusimicrobia bacterium]|nr:isochorismatase family protein [Elusimicrobiota bacterium]